MLDTKLYSDPGRTVLQQVQPHVLPTAPESEVQGWAELPGEEDRIRLVFGLPEDTPLPRVTMATLAHYHAYLRKHLVFPFQALYAETTFPVRHLVRYVSVLALLPVIGSASRGIHCRVEGIPDLHALPLVDIGMPDGHPNYQTLDDYAYWFLNSW